MADVAFNSSKTSSLSAAFNKASDNGSKFTTGMKQPESPGAYREVITVRSGVQPTIDASSIVSFTLPKVGIIKAAWLELRIKGLNATDKTVTWSPMLAAAIVENISLRTQSRELLSIDSVATCHEIEASPHKLLFKKLMGDRLSATPKAAAYASDVLGYISTSYDSTYTEPSINVYLPVMLSPLAPGRSHYLNCIDASFAETCSLQVNTRPVAKWCSVEAGATLPTGLEVRLCLDTVALSPELKSAVVKRNYAPGKSAQMIWNRSNLIGKSAIITPGAAAKIQRVPVTINMSSTDMSRGFIVCCERVSNADAPTTLWTNAQPKVERCVFQASGRTMFDQSRESGMFMGLDSHATDAHDPERRTLASNGLVTGAPAQAPESNALSVHFADGRDASSYQGALALSGLSSQAITAYIRARDNTSFRVLVYSNSVGVVSVVSDSGAILGSLSI